jgi:hypothetical protein
VAAVLFSRSRGNAGCGTIRKCNEPFRSRCLWSVHSLGAIPSRAETIPRDLKVTIVLQVEPEPCRGRPEASRNLERNSFRRYRPHPSTSSPFDKLTLRQAHPSTSSG